MGEFRKNLQKKVNNRKEKAQKEFLPNERLEQEKANIQMAYMFLEKVVLETKRDGYIASCEESASQRTSGKFSIFKKKLQRKCRRLYFKSVCAHNPGIQCMFAAIEDFIKAQVAWNQAIEEKHEAELKELKKELAELRKERSTMKASGRNDMDLLAAGEKMDREVPEDEG